jgi:alanyl-tRNA synthetase
MTIEEARQFGAIALFGETYDESVRVVQIGGPWSRELCGGTHVSRSSQIGLVSILGESSVGSGSRRVEALVGIEAFRSLSLERAMVSRLSDLAKVPRESVEDKFQSMLEELKAAQRKLASLQSAQLATLVPSILSESQKIGDVLFASKFIGDATSVDDIRNLAVLLRDKMGQQPSVAVVIASVDSKPMLVVAANQTAQASGVHAGNLVKLASAVLGGGGGGKADIAQGGGQDLTKIELAEAAIKNSLSE